MKIKSQYPAIVTNDVDKILNLLTHKGFRIIHTQKDVLFDGSIVYVLKHTTGTKLDVVKANVDKEKQVLRINVDSVEDAIKEFAEDGFVVDTGPKTNNYSTSALLKDPDGLSIFLMEHRKR